MSKRKPSVVGVHLHLLVAGAYLAWQLIPATRVDRDAAAKIRPGMSAQNVRAILGPRYVAVPTRGGGPEANAEATVDRYWEGESLCFHVRFNEHEIVTGTWILPGPNVAKEHWFEKFSRRAGF
jgi:hypothetical protein